MTTHTSVDADRREQDEQGRQVVMGAMLSPAKYAARHGLRFRAVQDLVKNGYIPGAVQMGNGFWKIPADALVLDEPQPGWQAQVAARRAGRPVTAPDGPDDRPAGPPAGRVWWTVDDLVDLFSPHVTRYAVERMLHEGELVGYRRGRGGSWLVATGELRRLMGS